METSIKLNDTYYTINLSNPIDISIALTNDDQNPIAWYQNKPVIEPVKIDNWTGKVVLGSSTNFNNIFFNPHAHGTHTECLGHITKDFYSINQCLKQFFFFAKVISVQPKKNGDDFIISKSHLVDTMSGNEFNNNFLPEALIIRTLPNLESKKHQNYSHTNPPFLTEEAAVFIRECNVKHLLIDLPSVDKEHDEGKLLAHKAFWNLKNSATLNPDAHTNATITEMIFVPNSVKDGYYFLNLQIASFENDASPSKPVLFEIL